MRKLLLGIDDYEKYSGMSFHEGRIEMVERMEANRKASASKYNKKVPTSMRWEVWERDDFTCQHCGSRKKLSIDHIYPVSLGGETSLDNLQTLCRRCNSIKGNRT